MSIDNLLQQLDACHEARKWAKDKSWQEIYDTCPRGDWLGWLYVRVNPDDERKHALIAGHFANTVRHLMGDPRSVAAVDAAIAYGEGRINADELGKARAANRRETADIIRRFVPIEQWNVRDEPAPVIEEE